MSQPLFSLVHSLSRSEKRYIRLKLNAGTQKGKNNFADLLNLLLAQEDYSEAELREAAAPYRWARQLATTKYQFYQWLLRHLRHFHEGNSLSSSIRDRLNEVGCEAIQRYDHADRSGCVIGSLDRGAEKTNNGVADELVDSAAMIHDDL